ncbi:MAG: PepSY domain-containing protein [Rhodopseudomonas sp.]|uniref:PepSY domain-containing protein n=1 Tax=Rhodopseudomonas sp. TaxID=1078 RepID=UPI0017F4E884|nr:PepSY domain-containing protein [Rhodopseudomonas sp.]NVN88473.1 PepSY domain-containing protein [Rhodopseudomonas sp.]
MRSLHLAFGLWLVAAPLHAGGAWADSREEHDYSDRHDRHVERSDHDAVRAAVERGQIKPLAELLAMVKDKLPGEITGVEIERQHDRWLYEFRVIDKAGRLLEVYVDANSGDIQRTKEK